MKKIYLTFMLLATTFGFSQENSFKIQFKNSEKTIRVICLNDCDFFEVELNINEINSINYISNKGLSTTLDNDAQFLFSIEKTENDQFKLVGLKNTNWKDFSFKTKGFWKNFLVDNESIKSL